MIISPDEKRVSDLKDYLQSKIPEISVHAGQTGPDEDEDVMSFFFSHKDSPGWTWRLRVSRQVLADRRLPEIKFALESQRWKDRMEGGPDGGVFVLKVDMRLCAG